MEGLDFLREMVPDAKGTLMVFFPDETFRTIFNVSPEVIANKCPLLALSFETGESGLPKAIIEARSSELVVGFLRYLYLGDYTADVDDDFDSATRPGLLYHAHMCQLAETFDVPELQVAAHANFLLGTELSCSLPVPPTDLCDTIRFIYGELAEQRPLIETVLNYCVFCFTYHKLGKNEDFRKLAFELRPFHRDLCRTNYQRGFDDDGAIDIVRLPVSDASTNPTAEERERTALGDFIYELWCDQNISDSEAEQSSPKRRKTNGNNRYTLVSRPKDERPQSDGEVTDEETGFTMVHRPKKLSLAAELDWNTISSKGKERATSDSGATTPSSPSTSSVSGDSSGEEECGGEAEEEPDEGLAASSMTIKLLPREEERQHNPNPPGNTEDADFEELFNFAEMLLTAPEAGEEHVNTESGAGRYIGREDSDDELIEAAHKPPRIKMEEKLRGAVRHDAAAAEDSDEELYRSAPIPIAAPVGSRKVKIEEDSDSEWSLL